MGAEAKSGISLPVWGLAGAPGLSSQGADAVSSEVVEGSVHSISKSPGRISCRP